MSAIAAPGLGLVFLLGLRHGLDPDHVAVIDNMTFRALPASPRTAAWTGLYFSLGHSVAVAAVAVGVSLVVEDWAAPAWALGAVDWLAIALMLLVGTMNLRALRREGAFVPRGWRQVMLPGRLRQVSHPLAIAGVGMIFGLAVDTASQAAAWGAAATSVHGVQGALAVAAAFAAGMILTDTADSQVVARLLRHGGDPARVARYRRGVGWLIVALSFGMAAWALAGKLGLAVEAPDLLMSAIGLAMVGSAAVLLAVVRRGRDPRPRGSRA